MNLLILGLCVASIGSAVASPQRDYCPNRRPNVIVILADDLGHNDLGYVNPEVITPNIDKLAHEGVILKNNYVMNVCTPTRHCMMTGRYPFKTQMSHLVIMPTQAHCSPTNIKFLPARFKEVGYNTYMTGKWHLGFCQEECLPTSRGFDHFYGYWQGEQDYYKHTSAIGSIPGEGFDFRNGVDLDRSVDGKFNTFIMNDWLQEKFANYDEEDPFFLYLAIPNVHTPLKAPQKYYDMYPDTVEDARRNYMGLASAMDDAIGNLTKTLKANGLIDNTLIVFSSDNGGEHGHADNMPYRGSKGSFFEGGVRALAFAHGPMIKKTGYEHEGLFHVTDWVPTLMGIINNHKFNAEADNIDGHDQSDMILNGGPSRRDDIVFNIDMEPMQMMGQSAVRVGDWKFIWGCPGVTDGWGASNLTLFYTDRAVRASVGLGPYRGSSVEARSAFDFSSGNINDVLRITAAWAFNKDDANSGITHLFNLKDDPYEYRDLSSDPRYEDKLIEMKKYVLARLEEYVPNTDFQALRASGRPGNYGGAWSTGWCEDLDIVMKNE